jgi:hypothetical protein
VIISPASGRLPTLLSRASIRQITGAIRDEVLGKGNAGSRALLEILGLLDGGSLTVEARDVYEAAFVYANDDATRAACRAVLTRQPITQALLQTLSGRPPMAFDGVLHLLALHHLASVDEPSVLRRFLATLNELGLVVWSSKNQTVRGAGLEQEIIEKPRIRVIQPDRPYTNVMHLRYLLRECAEYIWWAEPHLNQKALEPLATEVDPARVSEIHLLSGPTAIDDTTRRDWHRFKKEMAAVNINAEWRVLAKNAVPFHDRYLMGREGAWNVPPVNSLYKGSYAEATRCETRPPFPDWWSEGSTLELIGAAA